MAHRTYQGDPYWIELKFPGTCARCNRPLPKGERAFRYKTGQLYGESCGCGIDCANDFHAAAEDEDRYCGYNDSY